jgi:protein O-GlcNAc transferase
MDGDTALKIGNEDRLDQLFDQARTLHEGGLLDEAETLYYEILAADPVHADSLHLLGLAAHQTGRVRCAVDHIGAAVRLRADAAHYRCNLGNALRDLGCLEEAATHLRVARQLRPDNPQISASLGNVLLDLGEIGAAIACYRDALALQPLLPAVLYNLANALGRAGQSEEAEECYRLCLHQDPGFKDAHFNLGHLLMMLGRLEEAAACYRTVLRLHPAAAEAHNNLGITLHRLNRLGDAIACYEAALCLAPIDPDTHYNLGCALLEQNRLDEATRCYERALQLRPGHVAARFALCRAQLPILYTSGAEIAERRAGYATRLRDLSDDFATMDLTQAAANGTGPSPPFFLAYQGGDDRTLQCLHGGMVARIMEATYPPAILPPKPKLGEKLRVGIISGFFHQHTVWTLMLQGWLTQFDRQRFTVFGYHTGTRQDDETALAASLCERFRVGLSGHGWREAILADAPHALIYPEFGMDPVAAGLAAQRLARVQCVSWGHPVTTGLPTIDHWLSSDAMEPANGGDHYSEQLVRLPGLGVHYEPCEPPSLPLTRTELGLRPQATVYWSGQALYKYLPQYDEVFPRIAQDLDDCQFVFIGFERSRNVTELFRKRLVRTFAEYGLDAADHCVILPSLEHARFLAAIGLCDAVLDTIGWSGGKSTLEALTCNPAIVTLPGPLMRSRHTAAMLELMGAEDTIAGTVDEYVALAVRVAKDPAWRVGIQRQVAANKHRLHRDRTAIAALEDFLERTGR